MKAGSVVLIAEVAHEVLARTDATHVEVSKVRNSVADVALPPDAGTDLEVLVLHVWAAVGDRASRGAAPGGD